MCLFVLFILVESYFLLSCIDILIAKFLINTPYQIQFIPCQNRFRFESKVETGSLEMIETYFTLTYEYLIIMIKVCS
jgi:hypothetical protein